MHTYVNVYKCIKVFLCRAQITVLEQKVSGLEKLYGCQLVWKIEQWHDKVHEAKLGRKATIFSPPFLTSRHGYKMALSLCPYGDGKGTQTYALLVRTTSGNFCLLIVI